MSPNTAFGVYFENEHSCDIQGKAYQNEFRGIQGKLITFAHEYKMDVI